MRNRGLLALALLTASAAASARENDRQGPASMTADRQAVCIPPGSRWVVRQDRPILLVGDSITQGWMELGTNFDQFAYLDALARRGINCTLLWSFIGVVDQPRDKRIGYDAPELWPWPRHQGKFDLTAFHDAYFARLRQFVKAARSRNIVVVITVHDGWTKTRFDGHPFNRKNGGWLSRKSDYVTLGRSLQEMPTRFDLSWSDPEKHQFALERFCDRLIGATGELGNVVYELFNEGEWYDRSRWSGFQRHFLRFFARRTRQPLMVNDDRLAGREFQLEPRADMVSLHAPQWGKETSARKFFNFHQRHFWREPRKPFLFSETVPEYSGGVDQYASILRLLWGTALSGTGILFQNDTSWGFDSHCTMSKLKSDRETVLDFEGHLARFFNVGDVDLSKMEPSGDRSSTGVCLAADGEEYVTFSERGRSKVTLDLSHATGRSFSVRWFDPRTGHAQVSEAIPGGIPTTLRSPFDHEAVLHLKRIR